MKNEFNLEPKQVIDLDTDADHVVECDSVWDLLSVYADGEASVTEAEMVETHVAFCENCAKDLQFMLNTSSVMSTVEVEPPAELRSAILAATVNKPTFGQIISDAIRRAFAPAYIRYGAAAASAAGLFLMFAHNQEGTRVHEQLASNVTANSTVHGTNEIVTLPALVTPKSKDNSFASLTLPTRKATRSERRQIKRLNSTALLVTNKANGKKSVSVSSRINDEFKPKRAPISSVEEDPMPETIAANAIPAKADPEPTARVATLESSAPRNEEPATTTGTALVRYTLASSNNEIAGQAATFADLKRQLKSRNQDQEKLIEQNINSRAIRLSLLRRQF